MVLFLTSSLDTSEKDANGIRHPHNFGNENGILDNFKRYIKKFDNFVFVASQNTDTDKTDMHANIVFESFNMTLPFKKYSILDKRTKSQAKKLIGEADFIFLCGGHVPSQLEVFKQLNLRELIKNTDAVICGQSAGSMNSADVVYCPPELEEEMLDKNFVRYRKGLGLTNINIYPHWNPTLIDEEFLAGENVFENIMIKDSKTQPFIAYDDGTYILQVDDKAKLYGKGYVFENGKFTQLDKKHQSKYLNNLMEQ